MHKALESTLCRGTKLLWLEPAPKPLLMGVADCPADYAQFDVAHLHWPCVWGLCGVGWLFLKG